MFNLSNIVRRGSSLPSSMIKQNQDALTLKRSFFVGTVPQMPFVGKDDKKYARYQSKRGKWISYHYKPGPNSPYFHLTQVDPVSLHIQSHPPYISFS